MQKENMLGTERIPKLLVKFGLPSAVSMLVNSIYNIVDQIFIGNGVGYLGNAATNVSMPFVTIGLSVAMLISIGSAANVGLNLGRKKQQNADEILAVGLLLALLAGTLVMILGEVFMEPCLRAFGSTDAIMPYAIPYARIYLIGVPFTTVGIMLSDEARADGRPGFAMATMLAGALVNIICDPLFIFVFKWGTAGAALASILGQFVTMVMLLTLLPKLRTLNFKVSNMTLKPAHVKSIISLGVAPCITQLASLILMIIMNNQANACGALSKYGSDIPLAVFGIVFKINGLMMAILIGISAGTQPIFSFNYGAKLYDRVLSMVKWALGVCSVIGLIGTLCFQTFTQEIINLFGSEDALYNEFAVTALKTMTILIFAMSIQFVASTFFQSTGKPFKATILSLSRQLLFSIPLMYILPAILTKLQGPENAIFGIMWTFPVSDVFAILIAGTMMFLEIRTLQKQMKEDSAKVIEG